MNSGKRTRAARGASNLNDIVSKLRKNLTNLGMNPGAINTKINELRSSASLNKTAYATSILNKAKAAKARSNASKAAKTTKPVQRRKTPSNVNENPKTKLLNTLARLRNREAPKNGLNRSGYTFLASLYRNHPATQLKKYAFNWSEDQRIAFMKKQHQTLTKSTSRLNAQNETVNIPMNDEKMHDLLIMLWMDMSHDKLFSGSFNEFLNSSIKNNITQNKITSQTTRLVQDFIKHDILRITNNNIVIGSNIEQKQKKYMHEIWGDPSHEPIVVKKTASILSIVKNKSRPIYVSYDAENSDYITSFIDKTRMNNTGTYYLKRIFTIANLMDPGRGAAKNVGGFGKSGGSVNKLINRLFDETNTRTPFKFNYQMFKFNFGKYFTIDFIPDGYKFNATLNNKKLNMQIKKAEAEKGSDIDKISKTFGDFLQILTVAHLRKSGLNVVSSSQDGGFVGMTGFVQGALFGIEPALISDSTTVMGVGNKETGIKLYGLHNYLRYNATPNRSRVTTQKNNTNVRPGLIGKAVGFFGGNKKQNANLNNTQSSKLKPQTPRVVNNNNNTKSFVTASSNNLKNNNNVTQPTKKRKVNNNVRAKLNELERIKRRERELARLKN